MFNFLLRRKRERQHLEIIVECASFWTRHFAYIFISKEQALLAWLVWLVKEQTKQNTNPLSISYFSSLPNLPANDAFLGISDVC